MSDLPVASEQRGGVLHLTLNRPDKRNAMSLAMVETLINELDAAANNETIRAIVIRGAGGHFCAGDRKSTRLNSSHVANSYAVFCLTEKNIPASKHNCH